MRVRAPAIAMIVLGALLFAGAAHAVLPSEMLKDPVLEARARALSEELRCLVCQNQSIDDSEADLARDLRTLVRQRIQAGDTDDQARDYLVARYGPFILLKPQFTAHTILLWLAAPAVLILGALMAWVGYRNRAGRTAPVPLDRREQESLQRLLSKADGADRNITEP
jgi:cytochrome c-type biogenesis protein CcmH